MLLEPKLLSETQYQKQTDRMTEKMPEIMTTNADSCCQLKYMIDLMLSAINICG